LGDLRENEIKQILVELDWSGHNSSKTQEASIPLMSYEFSFKMPSTERSQIQGHISVTPTSDWEVFSQEFEPSVDVQLTIHEAAQLDKIGLDLVDRGKIQEALNLKKVARDILQRVKDKDDIGFIPALLMRSNLRIADLEKSLENSKVSSLLKKELHADFQEEENEDMGFGLFD